MGLIGTCLKFTLALLVVLGAGGYFGIYWVYQVFEEGELVLPNAPGKVSIIREKDTKIMTVRAESEVGGAYAQGFATA